MTPPCNAVRPCREAGPLAGLSGAGRVAILPVRLIVPGQALLAPFAQVIRVLSPAHTQGAITVLTAHNPRWYTFSPESWVLVLDPVDKSQTCAQCGRDWLTGCASECTARIVFDEDVAGALTAAGLAADYASEQLLAARP